MKKLFALMLALVLSVAVFASCGNKAEKETVNEEPKQETKENAKTSDGSDFDYISKKGKLVVGITEYEPMDYQKDGKWMGFDAELAQKFAESLGLEAEFVVLDWDNKFLELDSKAIDCVWNGMTITDEVKKNTAYTNPYAKNEQVVCMNKDKSSQYKAIEDMKDLTFAVESGSAAESAAADLKLNAVAVKAQSDALLEVKSGSADACIIDITMANSMTGEGTNYEDIVTTVSVTKEEYGVGFRKGSDMVEKLNAFFDASKEDGTLKALSDTYGVATLD